MIDMKRVITVLMAFIYSILVLGNNHSISNSNNYCLIIRQNIEGDTLRIGFQDGFEYDIVIVYANGIKIYENILYTQRALGSAIAGMKLIYIADSIEFKVVYYERNHQLSPEYNPLWWDWSWDKDNGVYYPKQEITFTINPAKEGKYLGIFLNLLEDGGENKRLKPSYRIRQTPFLYY